MAKNLNLLAAAVDKTNARVRRGATAHRPAATAAPEQVEQDAETRVYQDGRRVNLPQREASKATNLDVLQRAVARANPRSAAR